MMPRAGPGRAARPRRRGRPGQPLAAGLAVLLAMCCGHGAAPRAQPPEPGAAPRAEPPEDARDLAGQPVLALASHPAVTLTLRQATGGRQSILARAARQPGPPLRVTADGRFVFGWSCDPAAGCAASGLFLAFDAERPQVFLALFDEGRAQAWVPPRTAHWPAALEAPLRSFSPDVVGLVRFAHP
jgi:hypothetical protein